MAGQEGKNNEADVRLFFPRKKVFALSPTPKQNYPNLTQSRLLPLAAPEVDEGDDGGEG